MNRAEATTEVSDLGAFAGSDRLCYELVLERTRLSLLRVLQSSEREALETAITDIDQRLSTLPADRMSVLSKRLGLDVADVALLWNTIAVGHDPTCVAHASAICGPDYAGGLTIALHVLAANLDSSASRSLALRLNAAHSLVRELVLAPRGDIPGRRSFHVPDRVASFLAGHDELDPELVNVGSLLHARDDIAIDPEQGKVLDTLAQLLIDQPDAFVVLEGPDGVGRRTIIGHAADEADRTAICVDAARISSSGPGLESAVGALRREVLLRPRAVAVVAHIDALVSASEDMSSIRSIVRILDQVRGPVIVTSAVAGLEFASTRTTIRLRVTAPSEMVRAEIWRRQLGDSDLAIEPIAHRYKLGPGAIESSARAAKALGAVRGHASPTSRDVVDGVRTVIAELLGKHSIRIEPRETWSDVVLQADTRAQVKALIARVKHSQRVLGEWGMSARLARGTGVAALFSGAPGTGKTMLAGVVARELDLELYQVDLSKVVSKWVGETEKNLAQIFDAAEAGHALLLFDEADSLFAKRTEVKAAVDRYANLEVNYLLQRVEAFGGVTILTTNMDTSIDPALKRRLASHVVFWEPDEGERKLLWSKMIPDTVPCEGSFDFGKLAAEYPDMTGANIRNAALAATFLAAGEGDVLKYKHLSRAAQSEYRAMGRILGKKGTL